MEPPPPPKRRRVSDERAAENEAREQDDLLLRQDLTCSAKRNAVRLEGYESDSSGDERPRALPGAAAAAAADEAEGEDMFGTTAAPPAAGKEKKKLRFLGLEEIEGQDMHSQRTFTDVLDEKEGAHDGEEDEEDNEVDREVGAGGKKRNPPKLDAFNMSNEMEDGRVDENGNFVPTADPDAHQDAWLAELAGRDIRAAREASERRRAQEAARRDEETPQEPTADLLAVLARLLQPAETPLEALHRLNAHAPQRRPKWSRGNPAAATPEEDARKQAVLAITDAADKLLSRIKDTYVYDEAREAFLRRWQRLTGRPWLEAERTYEYKFDGKDEIHGPFTQREMEQWHEYLCEGVHVRAVNTVHFVPYSEIFL